jgi:microcystin-dependent protein
MAQSEKDVAMDSYISTITVWPAYYAPIDTTFCLGQAVPIQQNVALFSLIDLQYGGDPNKFFNLPNLAGRVPFGTESYYNGLTFKAGMKVGDVTTTTSLTMRTAVTLSAENLPGHTHPATFMPAKSDMRIDIKVRGDQSVNIPVGATVPTTTTPATLKGPQYLSNYQAGLQSSKGGFVNFPPDSTVDLATGIGGVNVTGGAGVTASPTVNVVTGGRVEVQSQTTTPTPAPIQISATAPVTMSTLQPSLALNFIITMNGRYPPRD